MSAWWNLNVSAVAPSSRTGRDEALARQREQPRRDVGRRRRTRGRRRRPARTPSRPRTPARGRVALRVEACRVAPRSAPGWKPGARDAPRRSAPDSRTIAANCSAKSGFPSAVDRDRARGSRRRRRRATAISASVSASESWASSTSGYLRPGGARLEQIRACVAEQHDRADAERDEVLEEVEHRRLGPVDVLEADEQRSLFGEALEHSPDAPEELVARNDEGRFSECGAKSLERSGVRRRRCAMASATASRPPRSRTSSTSGQYVIPAPYARQRPETTRALDSKDAATSRASRDFPTPAGAHEREHAAAVVGEDLLDLRRESSRARRRGRRAARRASARSRLPRVDLVESMACDVAALALRGEPLARPDLDRVLHERIRGRPDQDAARLCSLLEPLRQVDRIAGDEGLTGRRDRPRRPRRY